MHRADNTVGRSLSIVALATALLAGGAAAGPKPFGTVTTLQFAKGVAPRAALLADMDGDGADDLVVATTRRGGRVERAIEVHLRRKDGDAFVTAADITCELPPDVTAFAVGDVHEDAGAEIVLFNATGAFAWRPKGPEDARFVKLLAGAFLWQLPNPFDVFAYEAALRDVNGDGLDDIVLPEPDGWRVAVQRRAAGAAASFAAAGAPRVPVVFDDADEPMGSRKMQAKAKRNEIRIAVQIGDDAAEVPADLVDVTESVPSPHFADFDGDGRADLLAQTSRELCVWRQREGATFPEAPDAQYELPVPADRERRLDVSYGSYVADVDGDRRADCVMIAGDKRSEDVRTQVLVYVQGKAGAPAASSPLFGGKGLPTQLLRISGFGGSPEVVDVDGDGRRDLVLGSVRLDGSLDVAKVTGKGALDAELYVFRNTGAAFSERPDLTFNVQVKAEGLRTTRREVTAKFFGDVTGDGVRDLLLRDDPERLRVLMTRRAGDGLTVVGQALWETHVAADADVDVHLPRRGPPELLVLEDAQVLHVRFP
jgi:hypothetical protein